MKKGLIIGLLLIAAAGAARADEPLAQKPAEDRSAEIEARKSYAIPAAEILVFQYLLNRFDRHVYGADYASNPSTARHNLQHGWVTDNDPFETNQFGHPYAGAMYYGFARSAGLNFWESLAYTFAGSYVWEIAGENTPPSRNDQVATGISGAFFGEALYRMAALVLEQGEGEFWRELAATAIAPSAAVNRYSDRERFGRMLYSHNPAYYSRLQLGSSATTHNEAADSAGVKRGELLVNYSMDYGLPGKAGYSYDRPFDYFAFEVTGSSANFVETLSTRGLLFGAPYDAGERYRGIWGLYGGYDYFAPQIFRISSTALSLGTTGQYQASDALALQGSLLAGVGYAGVGTLHGSTDTAFHYGATPQLLAALRFIFDRHASLDLTARDYFVSHVGGASPGGHDNIARVEATLMYRFHKQHAVALRYLWARRDATFPGAGDLTQGRGTIGLYYALLGNDRLGVVDWR